MKKPKLFMAFNGDAAGLRDCLIEQFKHEQSLISTTTGSNWIEGVDAGKRSAYGDVISFLKKLTINESEHTDEMQQ